MPRSKTAALAALLLFACARTSENPPVVTAPVASATAPVAAASAAPVASAPDAAASASAGPVGDGPGPSDEDDATTAQFRACQSDTDCVAVKRVGCCHNGWMAAVNVSQKDAYAQSFTCAQRTICPMYIVRDTRVPKCNAATHLCKMVRTQP